MAGVGYYGSSTTEGFVPWLQVCQRKEEDLRGASRVLDTWAVGMRPEWFPDLWHTWKWSIPFSLKHTSAFYLWKAEGYVESPGDRDQVAGTVSCTFFLHNEEDL